MKAKELYPRVFSSHAEAYQQRLDEIMARGEARGRLRAIDLAAAGPGMSVLDLACGPGNLTRLLAAKVHPGGRVLGVDLARGMIDLAARGRSPRTWFAVMDMERLGLANESFDVVVCGHGLQFAPELGVALREARRVLKRPGRLVASVPAPTADSVWELIDEVVDRMLPPAPATVDDSATRAAVGSPEAFQAAAFEAGFSSASVEVVDEEVTWESAEFLVSRFAGWWQFAMRMEAADPSFRERFVVEATEAVRRRHPGVITTHGRNHILSARA